MRTKRFLSISLVTVFALTSVAFSQETETPPQRKAKGVIVGFVVPARRAAASWSLAGRIVEVNVEEGDRVKKGQLLARIDRRLYEVALEKAEGKYKAAGASAAATLRGAQVGVLHVMEAELSAARAQLNLAETSFKRLSALLSKNAVGRDEVERSKAELAQARAVVNKLEARLEASKQGADKSAVEKANAELDIAKAELKAAQIALDETVLRAPIDGIVTGMQSLLGDYVRPGRFCRIHDDSNFRIESSMKDLRDLKVGMKFTARFTNSGVVVGARLRRILDRKGTWTLILDLVSQPEGIRLKDTVRLELKD